jgi:pantoate--beta-alanine ligase
MSAEAIAAISAMSDRSEATRRAGRSIGFVPTMGALHAGHGSLIERARADTGLVVVSVFVNPIQFDRPDDFRAYARHLERDIEFCDARGVDVVFAPSTEDMYPCPPATFVEVTGLQDHLCGKYRPGHFRGVATVVAKLLHIVRPDRAYFGEKDAQQLAIIRRMVADLNLPVEIASVPTVREPDGLALSSRNERLSPPQRRAAPVLFRALEAARAAIQAGCTSSSDALRAGLHELEAEPLVRVEYFEVVDPATIAPVPRIAAPVRIAIAAWVGETRLIDNVYCEPA